MQAAAESARRTDQPASVAPCNNRNICSLEPSTIRTVRPLGISGLYGRILLCITPWFQWRRDLNKPSCYVSRIKKEQITKVSKFRRERPKLTKTLAPVVVPP